MPLFGFEVFQLNPMQKSWIRPACRDGDNDLLGLGKRSHAAFVIDAYDRLLRLCFRHGFEFKR